MMFGTDFNSRYVWFGRTCVRPCHRDQDVNGRERWQGLGLLQHRPFRHGGPLLRVLPPLQLHQEGLLLEVHLLFQRNHFHAGNNF